MTAHSNSLLGFFLGVLSPNSTKHLLLFLIVPLVVWWATLPSDVFAQPAHPGGADPREGGGVTGGKSSAVIGDSGYVVTIPEVRMKNIVGPQPAKSPRGDEEPNKPTPTTEKLPSKDSEETADSVPVQRLPFDPVDGDSPPETPVPQPPVEESVTIDEPPDRTVTEPSPAESPPKKESADKDSESPWLKPPMAPEEIAEKPFEPKKEVLRKKVVPSIPAVFENAPSKEALKPMSLESVMVNQMTDPSEWLPLDSRRDPEIVPPVETEPEPLPTAKPEALPSTETEEPSRPALEPQPMQPPEPLETIPSPAKKEPPHEEEVVKESIPPVEKLPPPAKEHLPSPLDEEVLDSREVKIYLKETAPILEELSLLMTRSPALTIEDYDPSDASASVIPQDILVKMNAMKRELQVLDAKTFAVIPPAKYAAFHSLIRQSIAQAHQACNSIIDYFQENKFENFQKAREHLLKAGDFIRRTRYQSDQG